MIRVRLCRRGSLLPAVLLLLLVAGSGCQRTQTKDSAAAEGEQLFQSLCAKCHGRDGKGGFPTAEGVPPPRNFRDADFQASRSDAQLREVIRNGRGAMPPFGALFDEAQTQLLVAKIRSFNPKK